MDYNINLISNQWLSSDHCAKSKTGIKEWLCKIPIILENITGKQPRLLTNNPSCWKTPQENITRFPQVGCNVKLNLKLDNIFLQLTQFSQCSDIILGEFSYVVDTEITWCYLSICDSICNIRNYWQLFKQVYPRQAWKSKEKAGENVWGKRKVEKNPKRAGEKGRESLGGKVIPGIGDKIHSLISLVLI